MQEGNHLMAVCVDLLPLPGDYAVSRLAPDGTLPSWVKGSGFVNVSYCEDELSIVCQSDRVPSGTQSEAGWTALKLTASFEFDEAGIVLSVIKPVSEADLGVFLVSTFYRDYLLIKTNDLDQASALLSNAGHSIIKPTD
jgi:hypothetical protein